MVGSRPPGPLVLAAACLLLLFCPGGGRVDAEASVDETGAATVLSTPAAWEHLRSVSAALVSRPGQEDRLLCSRYAELDAFHGRPDTTAGAAGLTASMQAGCGTWPRLSSATHNDIGMAWAGLGRPRQALEEMQHMMLWASMLTSDQYDDMPIQAMLSNLVTANVNAGGAGAYSGPGIAIVTLCAYDPILTPISALSADNKLRYSTRHGYKFLFEGKPLDAEDRPPAWSKVLAMEKHLGAADWVMWTDCDSLFTNFSRRLEALLPTDPDSPVHMLVSEDALMVNTGVFALRNCDWSRAFLAALWAPPESGFVGHKLWEQAAMQLLLSRARRLRLLAEGVCPAELRATLDADAEWLKQADALDLLDHVQFLPQSWINAYPMELATNLRNATSPLHAPWRAGALLESLSGCKHALSQAICVDMLRRSYERTADEGF